MINDIERVLVSEKDIDEITTRLATEITRDYKDSSRDLVLVCILKGSLMFMTELMKKINLPLQIDFMKVSSYGAGSVSTGKLNVQLDLNKNDLKNTDLLIIEDIIDSGNTLSKLVAMLKEREVGSIKTCTLLDKPERRVVDFDPDYVGTVIPDEFVVGFGLDYAEKYRNLPYIGVLKPSVYNK
jgi:hypoxanthine phosphoribosyltransferase